MTHRLKKVRSRKVLQKPRRDGDATTSPLDFLADSDSPDLNNSAFFFFLESFASEGTTMAAGRYFSKSP